MIKKIGFSILSLVLAYNTVKILTLFAKLHPTDFSTTGSVFAAIAINLMVTGAIAFLGFVYPTSKLLPNAYYQIKSPQLLQTLYAVLGVEYFRKFLLVTFYREKDNRKYFNGTRSGIALFDYHTRQSEFGHLIAFLLIALVSGLLAYLGHYLLVVWTLAINVFFNFYPVLLQRKHRWQISRITEKAARRRG